MPEARAEFSNNPSLRRVHRPDGGPPWQLTEDLKFRSRRLKEVYIVEEGYRSDLASVPWFFQRLLPKDGQYTLAAIVHDKMCTQKSPDIDYKKAAKIFRDAMIALGVKKWRYELMYRAVLWFGPRWP